MKVFVSADSTCDLPEELQKKYGISVLPLYINRGNESLKDGLEIRPDEIYEYFDTTGELCKTAAIPVDDYLRFFEEALRENDCIVHFTISCDMSSCYQNACLAAQQFEGRVFILDSRSLSVGISLLAMSAVELAAEGKTGAEIFEILEKKKEKLNVSFVLDTLKYLHKGGRCSGVAVLGANVLRLRPCIELEGGLMNVGKKYRGKTEKVFKEYVEDRLAGADLSLAFLVHSGRLEEAVLRKTEQQLLGAGFKEVLWARAGSTISCHCGPATMGVIFYNK